MLVPQKDTRPKAMPRGVYLLRFVRNLRLRIAVFVYCGFCLVGVYNGPSGRPVPTVCASFLPCLGILRTVRAAFISSTRR